MTVDYVWMGLPSHPNYYRDYPTAVLRRRMRAFARRFSQQMRRGAVEIAPSFEAMVLNNLTNVERMDYLRKLPKNKPALYLARGKSVRSKPFSNKVKIRVLAPEKDVSVYYGAGGHGGANPLGIVHAAAADGSAGGDWAFPSIKRVRQPSNLSVTDWTRLRKTIQTGGVDAIRAIDKAENNTSLVFLLEADGKRLLFTGDAEVESWHFIGTKSRKHMKPVDFLKVSHHGSANGTPSDVLDKLLPVKRKKHATVVVSTKSKVYGTTNPVPDADLLKELKKRCRKLVSTDKTKKRWVDVYV
jgi:hypothetical protein